MIYTKIVNFIAGTAAIVVYVVTNGNEKKAMKVQDKVVKKLYPW